jgi:hypothetical protein
MSVFFKDKDCYIVEENGIRDLKTRSFIGYLSNEQVNKFSLQKGNIIQCRIKYTDTDTLKPRPVMQSESDTETIHIINHFDHLGSFDSHQIEQLNLIISQQIKETIENSLTVYDENGFPLKYQFKIE